MLEERRIDDLPVGVAGRGNLVPVIDGETTVILAIAAILSLIDRADLPPDVEDALALAESALQTIPNDAVTTSKIADGSVTNAKVASMAANTVKVNPTNGIAPPADVALAARTVLGRDATGNLAALATSQLPGTPTNDAAGAGKIGEYIEASLASGSAASLVSSSPKTVTSITLTPGDWDVSATVQFASGATTTSTLMEGIISLSPDSAVQAGLGAIARLNSTAVGQNPGHFLPMGPVRISVSTTTTVYLCANSQFATSTMSAYGSIRARRMR